MYVYLMYITRLRSCWYLLMTSYKSCLLCFNVWNSPFLFHVSTWLIFSHGHTKLCYDINLQLDEIQPTYICSACLHLLVCQYELT